ncbi:hypothetical protein ADZ37_09605 [Pannonibacter phragmitetus]|uniref:hypothetical protein n=1 Tax=Pannonibacter phragmitetus TaxID=121719 RepID=UPI00067E3254|nr:hypothetical protein [Pannonibacter phragmitetus]KND19273.1 hypothetical protein ADZ37_09605 [Pannonibacter phragmitetus]
MPFLSLKTILLADAAACLAMGALLIAGASPLAAVTEIPAALSTWAGVLLLPVAAFIAAAAFRFSHMTAMAGTIILGNIAWIVASMALLVMDLIAPNAFGTAFIIAQALAVAVLTWLETTAVARRFHAHSA